VYSLFNIFIVRFGNLQRIIVKKGYMSSK